MFSVYHTGAVLIEVHSVCCCNRSWIQFELSLNSVVSLWACSFPYTHDTSVHTRIVFEFRKYVYWSKNYQANITWEQHSAARTAQQSYESGKRKHRMTTERRRQRQMTTKPTTHTQSCWIWWCSMFSCVYLSRIDSAIYWWASTTKWYKQIQMHHYTPTITHWHFDNSSKPVRSISSVYIKAAHRFSLDKVKNQNKANWQ